jgi:sulfoxide reductase heme-binding subunit YedZ
VRSAAESVHLVAATVGFLSFFLLWLAVVWGLILRNGWVMTRMRHSTVFAIHHTVALLGLTLGVVHAVAQLAVPEGPVRLVDQVVPFLNPSDPVGIGVGVVALELMIAAALSTLIQRRLGQTRWRALHALTYAAFMLLVAHVLISGSDVGPPYVWGSVLLAWTITFVLWFTSMGWVDWLGSSVRERMAGRQRGHEITVNVDARKCARFGFCEHEAPEVFRLRSDGRLAYRAVVPGDQVNQVIRAVEVCPARAIVLNRMPTTVMTAGPDDAEPVPAVAEEVPRLRGVPSASAPGSQRWGEGR